MNARNFYVFKIEFYDIDKNFDEVKREYGLVAANNYSEVTAFLEKRFSPSYFDVVSISISATAETDYVPISEKIYDVYASDYGVYSPCSDLTPDQFFE